MEKIITSVILFIAIMVGIATIDMTLRNYLYYNKISAKEVYKTLKSKPIIPIILAAVDALFWVFYIIYC